LQPLALYHFARAASYDGANSLPAGDRKQLLDYLSGVYSKYHGASDGLDKMLAAAKTRAMPPQGFTIQSKSDMARVQIEAEEAAARANPMLALWKRIRQELQADGGATYFENSVKDAAMPRFKGTIISISPATRPKELVLAIEHPGVADAMLKLDSPLPGKMEPGAEIEFEGVGSSYTKDPYMVIFLVPKSKIEGWNGQAAPTQKRGAAPKKAE
jgi:hypothetical protein